jgi:hypothetical protein
LRSTPRHLGNGRHSSITNTSSIGTVSNLAIQVFEHHIGSQFRAIPHSQALHVKRFDFLPSSAFLCALADTPSSTENSLKVSEADWITFKVLTNREHKAKIIEAIKAFNKTTAGIKQPEVTGG